MQESMRALTYSIPFLFLATAPLGYFLGGAWSFLTAALVPVVICGFDETLGIETRAGLSPDALAYRALPSLYICLQIAVTLWAAYVIASPAATLVESVGLTVSIGITA